MDRVFNNIWCQCITVLLLIAAVSGGILAIFNDVFYVSAEERTQRAIKKIYGEEKEYSVILDSEAGDTPFLDEKNYGRIDKIYTIDQPDTGEYDMESSLDELTELAIHVQKMDTVRMMKQIVPEFKSKNSIYEQLDN